MVVDIQIMLTEKVCPPLRFGTINDKLYRGAYPNLRNFQFLRRLRLKTIISLTPEAPTSDLVEFTRLQNIGLIHFPVIFDKFELINSIYSLKILKQIIRLAPLNAVLQSKLLKAINVRKLLV